MTTPEITYAKHLAASPAHYPQLARGQPCEKGETAAKSGCVPAEGGGGQQTRRAVVRLPNKESKSGPAGGGEVAEPSRPDNVPPGHGWQDTSRDYPSGAGGLTELNMWSVTEALNQSFDSTGKGVISSVPKADIPHLKKAIKNGHLERLKDRFPKSKEDGWILTQKGVDSMRDVGFFGHSLIKPMAENLKKWGLDKGPILRNPPE